MKLAYVTTYDASDVHAWSGSGRYILHALQAAGLETESIGGLKDGYWGARISRLKRAYYSRLNSKKYLRDREPAILKSYALQVKDRLEFVRPDVVFSPGTIPIAHLKTEIPIVFWTDATFAGMVNFYPGYTDLCAETVRNGNKMEQLALTNCRLAFYTSDWAAKTAIANYDVDPGKIRVVPFGANIDGARDLRDIDRIVGEKSFDICKLLFLGVNWQRKGGAHALAVAELLNRRGLRTELHVAGCSPPPDAPGFVIRHGFLSKQSEQGRGLLERLFSEAHFLILPSRADCVPVVLAEASSFGLPSLTTNVGGISTAIREGKNGFTFGLEEGPRAYCDLIERLMSSRNEYRQLAVSSFNEYLERLNWRSAGRKVFQSLQDCCG
jgi:glycosyltransferase involved in cell wall biosynthesis